MQIYLNLKREFFDAILCGEKKNEYRDVSAYYDKKIHGKDITEIKFRNGYNKAAPEMIVEVTAITRYDEYYDIELGRIISSCNIH